MQRSLTRRFAAWLGTVKPVQSFALYVSVTEGASVVVVVDVVVVVVVVVVLVVVVVGGTKMYVARRMLYVASPV